MTKPVFRRTGRRRPPLRAVLRTLTGAIDLASIMVGVIVIGVIAGVIAATVFAVIPWTQDRAAQANLDAVRTAESVTQVKDGKFLDMAGLIATNQIQAAPKVNVVTDAAGSCWAAASKSAAGPVYISSNLKPIAVLYVAGDTSGCTDLTALIASVGGPDPAAAPPADQFVNVTTVKRSDATVKQWNLVTSSANGIKLAATVDGEYLYLSTDAGVTWTPKTTLGAKLWTSLVSSDDGTKLVAGVGSGYLYVSSDSGSTWVEQTSFGVGQWVGLSISNNGQVISVSQYNWTQKVSVDGGLTWSTYASRLYDSLSASADGYTIVGLATDGLLYKSTDAGATFGTTKILGTTGLYIMGQMSVSDDGKTMVVATAAAYGSQPGYIKRSTDGGATWSDLTGAGSRTWSTLTASADGSKIVASVSGNGGAVYTSKDSGATWVQRPVAGSYVWKRFASTADGSKITAADYKSLYTFVYGP